MSLPNVPDWLRNAPGFVRAFLVNHGIPVEDNSIRKGANTTLTNCDNCKDLDLASLQTEVKDLKALNATLDAKVKALETDKGKAEADLKTATDALKIYQEAEKTAHVDAITKLSKLKADDLKARSLDELRLIYGTIVAVNPAEGTVKGVRGADGVAAAETKIVARIPRVSADGSIVLEERK